jgi:hypothetical protein
MLGGGRPLQIDCSDILCLVAVRTLIVSGRRGYLLSPDQYPCICHILFQCHVTEGRQQTHSRLSSGSLYVTALALTTRRQQARKGENLNLYLFFEINKFSTLDKKEKKRNGPFQISSREAWTIHSS